MEAFATDPVVADTFKRVVLDKNFGLCFLNPCTDPGGNVHALYNVTALIMQLVQKLILCLTLQI